MSNGPKYPKRLIEVDLPIRRISAHARREKYLSTITSLHYWWARRPLAACRAVICAALWPDPADQSCPRGFRDAARAEMQTWTSHERQRLLSQECRIRFEQARKEPALFDDAKQLRGALLDFIADFADWDNSSLKEFLDTSRSLTQAAHEALGGGSTTKPLVVDPFAGGGSIPLEALRIGADTFASDLNPVSFLLNKVLIEYVPRYGKRLSDEMRTWGEWVREKAEKDLADFYPKGSYGDKPIAYLWARTVQCEGPGCGSEVPLIRSLWLAKKGNRQIALQLVPKPKAKRVDFQIAVKDRGGWVNQDNSHAKIEAPSFEGTVKRGSATCPCCGFTTSVSRVRAQMKLRHGGANDARLMCIAATRESETGRFYRLPTPRDFRSIDKAAEELHRQAKTHSGLLPAVPDEPTPQGGGSGAGRAFSQRNYGMNNFSDLFTNRQLLVMTTLVKCIHNASKVLGGSDASFNQALQTSLGLAVSRESDHLNSLCSWNPSGEKMQHLFTRQALPIVWDFCESNPFGGSVGDWNSTLECCLSALKAADFGASPGTVGQLPAQNLSMPDNSANAFITDPPYYDAVPYADLSDFFYVWLKRIVRGVDTGVLTPKDEECIVDEVKGKDTAFFEFTMKKAMAEGRRILVPSGIGVLVFAHKSTSGWEAQLQAIIDAGWTVTGSWPIDTELATRLRARDSAALASSIHIVCRPREYPAAGVAQVGDWRDVLQELPRRIHEWMPRLAQEGVVGADAIFACLGPALEIFSRYSQVEKASGEVVALREYLENVWAAVSKEALSIIFQDADTASLEPDARLTAMWLWTLGASRLGADDGNNAMEEEDSEEENSGKKVKTGGVVLEFDAARKIAQGLGAHLEKIPTIVEVKGATARLLPVTERMQFLFPRNSRTNETPTARRRKKPAQADLFSDLRVAEDETQPWGDVKAPILGATVLDRLHQTMILFGAGRSEAMRRFLVDEGAGSDPRFWKLAQSLSALYAVGSDEKRWVDGVLARKKGLGL